jgi:hypothetical protein
MILYRVVPPQNTPIHFESIQEFPNFSLQILRKAYCQKFLLLPRPSTDDFKLSTPSFKILYTSGTETCRALRKSFILD